MKNLEFSLINIDFDSILLDCLEPIAKDGLVALKKLLDNSGFSDSPFLKDYEIESEISSTDVTFSILLNERAISDESRRKLKKETEAKQKRREKDVRNRSEGKELVRSYTMSPDGRPERVHGRRNAKKRRKDARGFQKDARNKAEDRNNTKHPKGSGNRLVEHELEATAPRNMEVDPDGKLIISMQREIRQTGTKMIFPQGNFQGIMANFLEEIGKIVAENFSKELDRIIKGMSK